ncbi:MAG: CDP-glucose 4,6-dehydratase, partial [Chthoniobacterales bacterium]
ESNRTVEEVVREILARWPGQWEDKSDANAPHEAGRLNLAIDKAFHLLDWSPVWNFETTIAQTVDWYRRAEKADAVEINRLTLEQIKQYEADWDDRSKRN